MFSVQTSGTLRPMLWLSGPVLAEELLNLMVGYTDWWLTGHYLVGPSYKAAMGLMSYVLWFIPSLFAAVAIGATALTARLVGGGDVAGARRAAHQALLLGFVVAAGTTAAAIGGGEAFIRMLRLPEDSVPLAMDYLGYLIPAIPAIMFEQIATAVLRGAGDTVTGLLARIVVVAVNGAVSAALVTGAGPFPEYGWSGLAIGTAIGHATGGAVLLIVLLRGRAGLAWTIAELRPDWELMRRVWRVGLPGGLDVLAVVGCHLSYVGIINTLGASAAGAHGLGVQIEALAYSPASSFAVAAATMTGQYLGAGETERARRGALTACGFGIVFMSGMGVLFFCLGWSMVDFFVGPGSRETADLATEYLRIVAVSMPFLATTMVLTGTLRGAGDTRWSLAVTFVGLGLIRIPGAAWLAWDEIRLPGWEAAIPGWDLGVTGAWWAMVIDVMVRSLLLSLRFVHGGWRRAKV